MTQEKPFLETIDDVSKIIKEYWVSHSDRIKAYDIVGSVDKLNGCLKYNLASPLSGFQVLRRDGEYRIVLNKPYVEVIFFRKGNKIAKKTPPQIKEINGYFPVDDTYLLGKDQIVDHLKTLAKDDLLNVDAEKTLSSMEEAIQKLVELRQQLNSSKDKN